MTIDATYLSYPHRHYGMDHDRYEWSDLFERAPVQWPNQARVALWVTPILQWFPLNAPAKPFRAPGGLTMPYPDFRHYSSRDYGNRVGIFRIMRVLKELGIPASVALNAAVAERYPALVQSLLKQDVELMAHGKDMGHVHHAELSEQDEAQLIASSVELLRRMSGQAVTGWLSPARSQSANTMDLLAAQGVRYSCDWANDDLPYAMKVTSGEHYAMPLAFETDDRVIFQEFHQNEDEWLTQIKDRFDVLYRESQQYGGRVMSVPLHAWVSGVPFRIAKVREALEYMLGHSGVWAATGTDILDAYCASVAKAGER
ncbi:polysaccharide deacetylase family protein [Paenalcaligenes suwonensis]|uniref:polysaccharide deacetylase family protein n=1 Tax=Paenalcaligenes suwonensis TaxID=1202713 RepID=UPI001408FEFC|nr:polysaccharide deacetylase family protein [Paenalcaligenes suwonensis]NHC62322.1 polysaccharide deacetylase family protein [Paenalcaligenes suwonensis]